MFEKFCYSILSPCQGLLVVGINMLLSNCGYGIGLTSPMISQLYQENLLQENMASWFASSLVLGQIIGSLFGAWLANRVGRKRVCIGSGLLSMIGWLILAGSQYQWMLILGRVWTGLLDCLIVPAGIMFISEASELRLKGSFLNSTAIASGLGIALANLIGCSCYWRLACLPPILNCLLGVAMMFFCYESPVYLLMKREDASDSLEWYRELLTEDDKDRLEVQKELKEMEEEISSSDKSLREVMKDLFQGENLRAYLIVGTLFMLFPLTGCYTITFFAVELFKKLDLGGAETVAIVTAFARCLGTSLSSVLLYKFGRRKLMIVSTGVVTLIMTTLASLVAIREVGVEMNSTLLCWALTLLIILFMFCVGLGLVSLPWVLMGKSPLSSVISVSMSSQPSGSPRTSSPRSPAPSSPSSSS